MWHVKLYLPQLTYFLFKFICMRILIVFLFFILVVSDVKSQEKNEKMRSFMGEEMQDFDKFISDANREFVSFLREAWTEFTIERPMSRFHYPEQPKPVIFSGDPNVVNLSSTEIKVGNVIDESNIIENKQFVANPLENHSMFSSSNVTENREQIDFCGTSVSVDSSVKGVCVLPSLSENDIADAYEMLCGMSLKALLNDIKIAQCKYCLNDWGVVMLVRNIADAFCPNHNSSIVMQQFIFNELGFKTRMARREDRAEMMMFIATDCQVYGRPYTIINGENYYNIDDASLCRFYMCKADYGGAKRSVSMALTKSPIIGREYVERKWVNHNGDVSVTLSINKSLIDFYSTMPQCDFSVYVLSVSDSITSSGLLASLSLVVNQSCESEAVGKLLNFVQTAFDYATDDEQFGYEKPFFVEETLFYPACDCEDRSILFARLVRRFIGLDVVLLDYPNHIATAVCFNEDVPGDYVLVEGKKFVVCDPTYIGASIGMTMPQFKNVSPGVLRYCL